MTEIVLDVVGLPTPQGSKKPFNDPRTGHARMKEETGERLKLWRQDVKAAVADYIASQPGFQPLSGDLSVSVVFKFRRPKNHYRTGRNAHLLRDGAPAYPTSGSTGDIDKLLRATLDALAIAGLFANDKQIPHIGELWKVYDDSPNALLGARIEIRPLEDPRPLMAAPAPDTQEALL